MSRKRSEESIILSYFRAAPENLVRAMYNLVKDEVAKRGLISKKKSKKESASNPVG